MGNTINKIDDGFYICGVQALEPSSRLRELGIKCVLNAAEETLYKHGLSATWPTFAAELKEFEVKIVGAADVDSYNMSRHFEEIADFIEAGRAKGGVVVHCAAGISRASTSACAYLMIKGHWSLNAAYTRVHGVRKICEPNAGFWRQLRDLEASLVYRGIELKELPADWVFPEQPPDGDDKEAKDPDQESTTSERIRELDSGAEEQEPFVTQHLTAELVPDEGVEVQRLAEEVAESKPRGIKWDSVCAGGKVVVIRAALVPTLDSFAFRGVLERMPGVRRAIVEGCA